MYLGNLSEIIGVDRILIIGGSGKQKGNISSSMEVLKTGLVDKFKYCVPLELLRLLYYPPLLMWSLWILSILK